ncbi:hypothetical protein [Mycoplasma todarodis]|uniref:hypothetical protein n=1 Tax=Mycoplasma todarodis TaxID=1937191 RepID=UPI003B2DED1C
MKISKKIGFGTLTALATVAVPLVTAVSCGKSEGKSAEEVQAKLLKTTHELIQDLFWNQEIDKSPSVKKEDAVVNINLSEKDEKFGADYYIEQWSYIYKRLDTDLLKNAFIILTSPENGEKLIKDYKTNLDVLDAYGLAIRQLMEDVLPNILNSVNSFKFNLTFKKKDNTDVKDTVNATKEFKDYLDSLQYVAYWTESNLRIAELEEISNNLGLALITSDNSDSLDLSKVYEEIHNSYQDKNELKEKEILSKLLKTKEYKVNNKLNDFSKLKTLKAKATEEGTDINSMINKMFLIDDEKKEIDSLNKELKAFK